MVGFLETVFEGSGILMSGFANSASSEAAWAVVGVRARRFKGRLDRLSNDIGIDSGIGSDIVVRDAAEQ